MTALFFDKHNVSKHIEAENHLKNKHIKSICPDWEMSLGICFKLKCLF